MVPKPNKKDQTACRASAGQKRRERFRASEEIRPRDAWPVSVVFGVEVGQVLVSPFAQLPLLLSLLAAAAARDSICARHGMLMLPLL